VSKTGQKERLSKQAESDLHGGGGRTGAGRGGDVFGNKETGESEIWISFSNY
jgi:hypothetical protein